MIRVAIYARFSSDLQNDKSVDDQIAFCREVCARNGMTVVLTFEDRAVSASSAKNRPGFIALMRAAAARLFDVVVAEDMDRIFRDQADYHAARKELDFLGITIHTATGKVTKIDGALRRQGCSTSSLPKTWIAFFATRPIITLLARNSIFSASPSILRPGK
jgi:site-specific DNA recombinase